MPNGSTTWQDVAVPAVRHQSVTSRTFDMRYTRCRNLNAKPKGHRWLLCLNPYHDQIQEREHVANPERKANLKEAHRHSTVETSDSGIDLPILCVRRDEERKQTFVGVRCVGPNNCRSQCISLRMIIQFCLKVHLVKRHVTKSHKNKGIHGEPH